MIAGSKHDPKSFGLPLSEPLIQGGLGAPRIQGLAVFAGMFKSDPTSLHGRAGEGLARMVVGSPIYIRQR